MKIIGLTGTIASGKSTVAKYLKEQGLPVFDADAIVHDLYNNDQIVIEKIREIFPEAIANHQVDRKKLSRAIQNNETLLTEIEDVVHPIVSLRRREFLEHHADRQNDIVILDIPLLFEKRLENSVDEIILVITSPELQIKRAMERQDMSEQKLKFILSHQLPHDVKISKSQYIIENTSTIESLHKKIDQVINQIREKI